MNNYFFKVIYQERHEGGIWYSTNYLDEQVQGGVRYHSTSYPDEQVQQPAQGGGIGYLINFPDWQTGWEAFTQQEDGFQGFNLPTISQDES